MNLFRRIKANSHAFLLAVMSIVVFSCDNREPENVDGSTKSATVTINMLGSVVNANALSGGNGVPSPSLMAMSASTSNQSSQSAISTKEEIQTRVIQVDPNFSIVATLVPEDLSSATTLSTQNLVASNAKTSVPNPSAATVTGPVQTPLANGVRYRVLVYNKSTGVLAAQQDFTYNETPTAGIALDGETEYTFIAYSINSKDPGTAGLPATPSGNLSTVSLSDVTGDLMYFKKDLVVKKGDNHLDVVLVHQFSKITTIVQLQSADVGKFVSIAEPTITMGRQSGSIKLSDGALSYSGTTKSTGVTFRGLPRATATDTIQSVPTLLIAPATTAATYTITSFTVGGKTLGEVELTGLNITPGRKYNLILDASQVPCTQEVAVGDDIDEPKHTGPSKTYTYQAPAADYGFTFDITTLDNSFNMTINGVALIKNTADTDHEVQFENNSGSGLTQNIRFKDGTTYGGGASEIWSIFGTDDRPAIRVVIDVNGNVSMYGSKSTEGDLYPLELIPGYTFNNVDWSATGPNEVIISQAIQGDTQISGRGSGKQIRPCN